MADFDGLGWCFLVTIFLEIVTISHTSSYNTLLHTRHALSLDADSILNTLSALSIDECVRECLSRRKCLSISYHTSAHVCHLVNVDGYAASSGLVPAKGYVHSDVSNWIKFSVPCSGRCGREETCVHSAGGTLCQVRECGPPPKCGPPPGKPGTDIYGNIRGVGARMMYVCTSDPCSVLTSTCQSNGTWSRQQADVCRTDMPLLEGKLFHIRCPETGKHWHADASNQNRINTQWSQGPKADSYTEFSFIKLNNSINKFLIRHNHIKAFVTDAGQFLVADPLAKPEPYSFIHSCQGFRLYNLVTQRYVHLATSGFPYVTTQGNLTDETSIFTFDELVTLP